MHKLDIGRDEKGEITDSVGSDEDNLTETEDTEQSAGTLANTSEYHERFSLNEDRCPLQFLL